MSSATAYVRDGHRSDSTSAPRLPSRRGPGRVVLHAFLMVVAVGWLFPIGWAVLNSFRDYAYTAANGYVSFGGWTLGQLRGGLGPR